MGTYRLASKTPLICLISRIPLLIISGSLFFGVYKFHNIPLALFANPALNELVNYLKYGLIFLILILCLSLIIYAIIQPHYLYKNTRIIVSEKRIEYKTGMLFAKTIFLPITTIQQVELNTNVLKQHFNTSSINISTSFISFQTGPIDTEISEEIVQFTLKQRQLLKGEHHEN